MSEPARWYVVHTYSGYENKVAATIQSTVDNRGLSDLIVDIRIPLEKVIEIKDNARKEVDHKLFPGYVLVKMVMNDDSWHVVRNTRGVTGFVGPGSKPTPLTDSEVAALGVDDTPSVRVSYAVGDSVFINEGPLEGHVGVVEELDIENDVVKVVVSMFGRETPAELSLDQVESMDE